MGKSLVFFLFLNCILIQGLLADPTEEELLAWKAPEAMIKDCPYYLLKYVDDSPLWLIPFGRWNDTKHIAKNNDVLSKNVDQGVARAIVSGRNNSGFMMIVDLDGMGGLLDPQLPFFIKKKDAVFKTIDSKELKHFWVINAQSTLKSVVDARKGQLSAEAKAKVEAFTTPEIEEAKKSFLKRIPKSILPEKYGGDATFEPIQTHG